MLRGFFVDVEDTPFKVTGATKSPCNERSEKDRQSFMQRMADRLIVMHTSYLIIAAVTLGAYMKQALGKPVNISGTTPYLHTGLALCLVEILFAALVPVRYMAFPPSVPERSALLETDEYGTHRARNKEWVKRERGKMSWVKMVLELFLIVICDWL